MKMVYHLIVWFVLFVIMYVYSVDDRIMQIGDHRAYASVIGAAHDAAIKSRQGMEDGRLNFDPTIGESVFRQSLAEQLWLYPTDLTPKPDGLFHDPVKIIGLYFLGDDAAPKDAQGAPVYPWNFTTIANYRGTSIVVNETIYGPSVVGIIEFVHDVVSPNGIRPVSYKKATYRYYDRAL